jgi:multicomponent Na+:H+ antiporter subunit C
MNPTLLFSFTGLALFFIGLFHLIAREHLLKKILAANIMGSGIFLVLVSLARRAGGPYPDPVPHALVLTGIVVTVSATALALTLLKRMHAETGSPTLPEDGRE